MEIITLLGKMIESFASFDIFQNDDEIVYFCYIGSFVAAEIESIVDVAERREYSVIFKADDDCRFFEIAAIRYEDDDGNEVVCDVRDRIRNEMKSRGLLQEYHRLCEEAVDV